MKVYHDHNEDDTWTEITGIIEYPNIVTRLNQVGSCQCTIRDFEGALYSTWKDYDHIPMKVEDDNSKVIFRGFLTGKKFTSDSMILNLRGLGYKLEVTPLNKNYILLEGKISACPGGAITGGLFRLYPDGDGTTQDLHTSAEEDWEMIDDVYGSEDEVTYIFADSTDDGQVSEFTIEDDTGLLVDEVTTLTIWSYARNNATLGNNQPAYVACSWNDGADWEVDKTLNLQTTYAWRQSVYSGLSKTRADLNKLRIRFKAKAALGANEQQYCSALHVRVTYNGNSPSGVDITDDEDLLFTDSPNADYWINDRDVGLLVVDSSGNVEYETWYVEAEGGAGDFVVDGTYTSGDNDSFDASNDIDTYNAKDTATEYDMVITPIVSAAGGDEIADAQQLDHIEIDWRWGCKTGSYGYMFDPAARFRLEYSNNGTDWTLIKQFKNNHCFTAYQWFGGTRIITGTNAELAAYLNKTGSDYTSFKHIRMRLLGASGGTDGYVKLDKIVIRVYYFATAITPVMDQIADSYADGSTSWLVVTNDILKDEGVAVGDYFKIGENTNQILYDVAAETEISINIQSTLTKYIARWYKGDFSINILKGICLLEGCEFFEDYTNNEIVVSKEADFVDSTVDLTSADYDIDWKYDDECNDYKKVEVFGNASFNIYAFKEDVDSASPKIKSLIDETITTMGEAQDVADTQYIKYSVKRPSIRLTLHGTREDLKVGTTATITLERPTVAEADYPIRRIDRSKKGKEDIKTVIYAGLGESPVQENISNIINEIGYAARKAHADRLISTPWSSGASIQWGDVGGGEAAVNALIAATYTNAEVDALVGDTLVLRTPNPESEDFLKTDLTNDTNWNDLDLSGIIPEGATWAYLRIYAQDNVDTSRIFFRENGETNAYMVWGDYWTVANKYKVITVFVPLDANRIIEIYCNVKPTDWVHIEITVLGWKI